MAGMQTFDRIDLIARRLAEIEQAESKLRTSLDALLAERRELDNAQHVIERLAQHFEDSSEIEDAELQSEVPAMNAVSIPKDGSPRPEGIPTMAAMIEMVLRDFELVGTSGVSGRDLVLNISKRWWPGVGWNSVLPTAIRLAKKGRFGRAGTLYTLASSKHEGSVDGPTTNSVKKPLVYVLDTPPVRRAPAPPPFDPRLPPGPGSQPVHSVAPMPDADQFYKENG